MKQSKESSEVLAHFKRMSEDSYKKQCEFERNCIEEISLLKLETKDSKFRDQWENLSENHSDT